MVTIIKDDCIESLNSYFDYLEINDSRSIESIETKR
jgi:hypothetical protein